MKIQLAGDFTDEQNVALPASYLQVQSTSLAAAHLTSAFHGLVNGTRVITASTAHGFGGVTIQAATAFTRFQECGEYSKS